jgi:enamine deaminase RidA (YjgF/YER057c/UK114 family)
VTGWEPIVPASQAHIYSDWHLAPAVRAGSLLLCSGVLGADDEGRIPDEPRAQYHRVFSNLRDLLSAAGAGLNDIAEMTSFHLDLPSQIGDFSEVKDEYVGAPYPAWTAVEVAGIGAGALPGALVEVKVVAYLPQ